MVGLSHSPTLKRKLFLEKEKERGNIQIQSRTILTCTANIVFQRLGKEVHCRSLDEEQNWPR